MSESKSTNEAPSPKKLCGFLEASLGSDEDPPPVDEPRNGNSLELEGVSYVK